MSNINIGNINNILNNLFTPDMIKVNMDVWLDSKDPFGDGRIPDINGDYVKKTLYDKSKSKNNGDILGSDSLNFTNLNGNPVLLFKNEALTVTVSSGNYNKTIFLLSKNIGFLPFFVDKNDKFVENTFQFDSDDSKKINPSVNSNSLFLIKFDRNNFYIDILNNKNKTNINKSGLNLKDYYKLLFLCLNISQNENDKGLFLELIIYDKKLNDSDINKVEGYLVWKWGLQSSDQILPVTHPYFMGPPDKDGNVIKNSVSNSSPQKDYPKCDYIYTRLDDCNANIKKCNLNDTDVFGLRTKITNMNVPCYDSSNILVTKFQQQTNVEKCQEKCPCIYGDTPNDFIPDNEGCRDDDKKIRNCYINDDDKKNLFSYGKYNLINGPMSCPVKSAKMECNSISKCYEIPDAMKDLTTNNVKGFHNFNGIFENFTSNIDKNLMNTIESLNIPLKEFFDVGNLTSSNNTNNTKSPINNLSDFESNILESLYLFNNEYNYYLQNCDGKEGEYIPRDNINNPNNLNCNNINKTIQLDSNKIVDYINNNKDSIINNLQKKTVTDASYAYINDSFKDIMKKRQELDLKLREIYDIDNIEGLEYNTGYDTVVYGGITITILSFIFIYFLLKRNN
jgi:hypothetical protein